MDFVFGQFFMLIYGCNWKISNLDKMVDKSKFFLLFRDECVCIYCIHVVFKLLGWMLSVCNYYRAQYVSIILFIIRIDRWGSLLRRFIDWNDKAWILHVSIGLRASFNVNETRLGLEWWTCWNRSILKRLRWHRWIYETNWSIPYRSRYEKRALSKLTKNFKCLDNSSVKQSNNFIY